MIVSAIQKLLWADPYVASQLGRWDFGDGVMRPAVFTSDPAPEECPNPLIVLTLDGVIEWSSSRATSNDAHIIDLRVWGDKNCSDQALRSLAFYIKSLLRITLLDLVAVGSEHKAPAKVGGPVKMFDEDGFPGYQLSVEVKVIER